MRALNIKKILALVAAILVVAIIIIIVVKGGDKDKIEPAEPELRHVISVILDGDKPSGKGITSREDFEISLAYMSKHIGENAPLDKDGKYFLKVDWPRLIIVDSEGKVVGKPILSNVDNFDANAWVNRNGQLSCLSENSEEFAVLGGHTVLINENYQIWGYGCKLYDFDDFCGFVDAAAQMAVFIANKSLNFCNGSTNTCCRFPVSEIDMVAEGIVSGKCVSPSPLLHNYSGSDNCDGKCESTVPFKLVWNLENHSAERLDVSFQF